MSGRRRNHHHHLCWLVVVGWLPKTATTEKVLLAAIYKWNGCCATDPAALCKFVEEIRLASSSLRHADIDIERERAKSDTRDNAN